MARITAEPQLPFNGSLWLGFYKALGALEELYSRMAEPLGLSVIEWYILRGLYERDGQHASELARLVVRKPTSFTPNLDKLQHKGWIERRPDPDDRRAVHIHLTDLAKKQRTEVLQNANKIDAEIRELFEPSEFKVFLEILATMSTLEPT